MKRTGGDNSDAMSQLQLTALGLTGSLNSARCLCLPLLEGGVVLCCVLLIRSIVVLSGGPALVRTASQTFLGTPASQAAVLVEGLGDAAAAVVGILGVLAQSSALVMAHVAWLALHASVGAIVFPALVLLYVTGGSVVAAWGLLLTLALLALDLYLLFKGVQVLLCVALREKVSPGVQYLISASQRTAAPSDDSCRRRHLLLAILRDPDLRVALRNANVAVERLEADMVSAPQPDRLGAHHGNLGLTPSLPLAADLQATVEDATFLQKKSGDDKLLVSHIVLALCTDGQIEVDLPVAAVDPEPTSALYPVSVERLQQRLIALRVQFCKPQGAPGPTLLGLPLEETVAVYAALQVAVHGTSLCSLAVLGHGWGPLLGLREPWHLHGLQLFEGLVGVSAGVLGLVGVAGHRRARWAVHEAAQRLGAKCDVGLDVAWSMVRREPEAAEWHALLKRGAQWVGLLWLWTLAELFLSVPIVAMWLLESNVCGLHIDGLAHVGQVPGQLLHCGPREWLLLGGIAGAVALEVLLCWGTLALWHEYAHGWTTTDLRGIAHFMSFSLLPEPAVLALAGLQRRFQGSDGVGEKVPLRP